MVTFAEIKHIRQSESWTYRVYISTDLASWASEDRRKMKKQTGDEDLSSIPLLSIKVTSSYTIIALYYLIFSFLCYFGFSTSCVGIYIFF